METDGTTLGSRLSVAFIFHDISLIMSPEPAAAADNHSTRLPSRNQTATEGPRKHLIIVPRSSLISGADGSLLTLRIFSVLAFNCVETSLRRLLGSCCREMFHPAFVWFPQKHRSCWLQVPSCSQKWGLVLLKPGTAAPRGA